MFFLCFENIVCLKNICNIACIENINHNNKTMDEKFSLEYQYKIYLKRVGITEDIMHPEQKIQTKQAFYGAIGQLLILLRDDMYNCTEDEAVQILQSMLNEVTDYFLLRTQN